MTPSAHGESMGLTMASRPLITVECDIPSGMTIREWRRQRALLAPRPARRHSPIASVTRRLARRPPSAA